jgi:hypothetical protein
MKENICFLSKGLRNGAMTLTALKGVAQASSFDEGLLPP